MIDPDDESDEEDEEDEDEDDEGEVWRIHMPMQQRWRHSFTQLPGYFQEMTTIRSDPGLCDGRAGQRLCRSSRANAQKRVEWREV